MLGIGFNWGRPNRDTFGADLDDQLTAEIFYRWQLTNNIQVTPSIQVVGNPALNAGDDVVGIFGVRARLVF